VATVARYVKLTAKPGQGDALADAMLATATALAEQPGCLHYIVNRAQDEPDVVWVTELWQSQRHLDESLETDSAKAQIAVVRELLAGPPERIDLEPVGGHGYQTEETGFTIANLEQVEDSAAKFGYGEMGEARFAGGALRAVSTGLSHQRLRPGRRQMFAHRHHHAEEVYIVLAGNGRVKIDDEIRQISGLDAIRIAPGSTRAFEAGPDGLEVLALGPHRAGDAQMVNMNDFWPT
jgi:quinol monooxygenase YgiN/mannose-6-phosphate isomerase-like protein (cupin superfamily)